MSTQSSPPIPGSGLCPGDENDPRDGPFSDEERAEAVEALVDTRRWHKKTGADILALRLQVGRGRSYADVSGAFGVCGRTMLHWRRRDGEWNRLSERDCRDLSRRVWLCGLARESLGEAIDKKKLREVSEWRAIKKLSSQVWRPSGPDEPNSQFNTDTNDDASRIDALEQQREHARSRLDALIARMEREIAAEDSGHAQEACAPEAGETAEEVDRDE